MSLVEVVGVVFVFLFFLFFFFNDTATTEIYTLSLHDALPILLVLTDIEFQPHHRKGRGYVLFHLPINNQRQHCCRSEEHTSELQSLTNLVCRLLLEKKKKKNKNNNHQNTVL